MVKQKSLEKVQLLEELAGAWKEKIKISSVEYVKEIRNGWEKRRERF